MKVVLIMMFFIYIALGQTRVLKSTKYSNGVLKEYITIGEGDSSNFEFVENFSSGQVKMYLSKSPLGKEVKMYYTTGQLKVLATKVSTHFYLPTGLELSKASNKALYHEVLSEFLLEVQVVEEYVTKLLATEKEKEERKYEPYRKLKFDFTQELDASDGDYKKFATTILVSKPESIERRILMYIYYKTTDKEVKAFLLEPDKKDASALLRTKLRGYSNFRTLNLLIYDKKLLYRRFIEILREEFPEK